MNANALPHDDLRPREPKGRGPGLLLALLVHGGLVAAIAIGVNWRVSEPEGVEAELWSAVPQAAAPRAVEPPPPPQRQQPQREVTPPKPEPRPEADIAQEKERERVKREKQKAEDEKKAAEQKKREQQKQEQQKQEQEKLKQEKLKQEQAEKKERARKEEAEKKQAEQKREDAERTKQAAAQRDAQLKRIQGLAGATGGPNATGTALRSAGASSGYGGRIVAALKPHAVFSDSVPGNPRTEVEIRVAPSGAIQGTRLLRSSGVPSWDAAVLRAIEKAQRLPLDTDGTVQNPTIISWGPND